MNKITYLLSDDMLFHFKDDLIDYLLEHCDDELARSIKRGGKDE